MGPGGSCSRRSWAGSSTKPRKYALAKQPCNTSSSSQNMVRCLFQALTRRQVIRFRLYIGASSRFARGIFAPRREEFLHVRMIALAIGVWTAVSCHVGLDRKPVVGLDGRRGAPLHRTRGELAPEQLQNPDSRHHRRSWRNRQPGAVSRGCLSGRRWRLAARRPFPASPPGHNQLRASQPQRTLRQHRPKRRHRILREPACRRPVLRHLPYGIRHAGAGVFRGVFPGGPAPRRRGTMVRQPLLLRLVLVRRSKRRTGGIAGSLPSASQGSERHRLRSPCISASAPCHSIDRPSWRPWPGTVR